MRVEAGTPDADAPRAEAADVAAAIVQCIDEGARVINVDVTIERSSPGGEHALEAAVDYATEHDVGVVVPATPGHAGTWKISAHPWVIPVVPYDLQGRPIGYADRAIGLRGVGAPGADVTSLGADMEPVTLGGASIAAPFVTGAKVLGVVGELDKSKKIRVFKKKRRKQYRRTKGHRSLLTRVRITDIQV